MKRKTKYEPKYKYESIYEVGPEEIEAVRALLMGKPFVMPEAPTDADEELSSLMKAA